MSDQTDHQSQLPAPRVGDLWVNPNTNELLNESEVTANSSLRSYFAKDINGALTEWGALQEEVAALSDVKQILEKISSAEGAQIHEVFFPKLKSYVAIVFENIPDRASAWIYFGHVDHRCELPGSTLKDDGIWRTLLPTSNGSGMHMTKPTEGKFVNCPNCFGPVSVNSQCDRCEWSPSSNV